MKITITLLLALLLLGCRVEIQKERDYLSVTPTCEVLYRKDSVKETIGIERLISVSVKEYSGPRTSGATVSARIYGTDGTLVMIEYSEKIEFARDIQNNARSCRMKAELETK